MKNIYTINENKVEGQISTLNHIAEKLTRNLAKLELYNNIDYLIDKDMIFYLTFHYNNNDNMTMIRKKISKNYMIDNTNEKLGNLILVLFLENQNRKINNYPDLYFNLESLEKDYSTNIDINDFNFDYTENKVSVKESTKQRIKDYNTIYYKNNKQIKTFEIIEKIEKDILELKKYVGNEYIYYDLYKCYNKENDKLSKLSIYERFLNDIV